MGNIISWLCPKKKAESVSYDVHEETFEMDEQIGDLGDSERATKIMDYKMQNAPESNEALQFNESNKNKNQQQIDERKFLQHKNKLQQEKKSNQHQQQKKLDPLQQIKPVEEKKKMPIMNILPYKKNKKQFNPDDYRFIKEDGAFKIKKIDSIKKQQFNIDNCKNSSFFIFDITANLYVDDSENCFIFLAPCESTIFVRNCKNMVIIAATGQFRTYECHNCHFSLYCKSQPVIQSSSDLHFSSFTCPQYQLLSKQFSETHLYPWNNNWSEIHNFTQKQGEKHHDLSLYPDFEMIIDWETAYKQAELEITNQKQTIVPLIHGSLSKQQSNSEAVLVFNSQISEEDSKISEWINKNNISVLRAHKHQFPGHGKSKIIAIKIVYIQDIQLDLNEVSNPIFITEKAQVEKASAKYFISFGDER